MKNTLIVLLCMGTFLYTFHVYGSERQSLNMTISSKGESSSSNNMVGGNVPLHVDIDAIGNNDGSSWANAYTNLSDALENAEVGEEIWVADGTYLPNIPSLSPDPNTRVFLFWQDAKIYGGFNGTETSRDQRDPVVNASILSGDINGDDIMDDLVSNRMDNLNNVIIANNTVSTAMVLDGFTIIGGHADATGAALNNVRGGGLFSYGPMELNNCIFTQNYADFGGGAYYRDATSSGAHILNCTFEKNSCGVTGGGLISGLSNDMTVDNCTFIENTSGENGAGFSFYAKDLSITNSSFINNNAASSGLAFGGGLDINSQENASEVVVENCQFIGNTSSSYGGGISLRAGSNSNITSIVKNCLIEENSAGTIGAGLYSSGPLSMTISHITFTNNNNTSPTAPSLAMGLHSSPTALTKVENCLFNEQSENSGATTVRVADMNIEFTNCTFNSNAVGITDITNSSNVKLQNNIINTPGFANVMSDTPENQFTSLGGNLFSDATNTWALAEDQIGADPLFESGTFELSENSPAVDAGVLPDEVADADLAGNMRIQGGCIDIGAYESNYDAGIPCLSVGTKEDIVAASIIEIFPNPVSNIANITVENDWRGSLSLRVVTILGQTVHAISVEKDSEAALWNLDTTKLAKGTYRILLSNGHEMAVKTFVVI